MHKRLVGIAASAVVIVAACGGATNQLRPGQQWPLGRTGFSHPSTVRRHGWRRAVRDHLRTG